MNKINTTQQITKNFSQSQSIDSKADNTTLSTKNITELPNVYYGKDLVRTQPKTLNAINNDITVVFEKLKDKDGEDFANTAYKELVKYFGLSGMINDELTWKDAEGRPIVGDYMWYENKVIVYRNYFEKMPKDEQISIIAHELTHAKQTINILTTEGIAPLEYAYAISISDFNANMINNPKARQAYEIAKKNGNEKEFKETLLKGMTLRTYKELTTVFADVLKMPKHSIESPEGQKALHDLKAQALANGADMNVYNNDPLEKEAFAVGVTVAKKYRQYLFQNY